MPKFCSQCGSPISDDAVFCNSCGAKVSDSDKTTVENTTINQSETNSAQTEVIKEPDKTGNEANSSDTITKSEVTEAVNDTASVSEVEATSSEPKVFAAQQPSDDPTAVDKGIAFAKDKIEDGYEKFKTSPNRDRYIGFAAIGIIIIFIVCVFISIFFGGGYKSVVKDYMKAIEKGNFSAYVNSTPKIIYKAILEENYDGDKSEMKGDFKDDLDELFNYINDLDYDILDSEKLDSDDVDELEDHLRRQYGSYVDKKIKVSKAYEVSIRIAIDVEDYDKSETSKIKQELIVAKVNGDWGVVSTPSSLLNSLY